LRAWIEVVVEDASLEEDLIARVQSLTEGRDFDVLKVVRGQPAPISGMTVGEATDDEAIETLLDQPARVFEHLLEQHDDFSEKEIEELETAFALLIDLDGQSEPVEAP
jgi:hypothetical protein